MIGEEEFKRRPAWLKVKIAGQGDFAQVNRIVKEKLLNTVCQSARCPNIGECWARRTATFMIMGNVCTRNCRFCAVLQGMPEPLDSQEPGRVAEAVHELGLHYAVITSVTRDDLADGGADHFARTIKAVKRLLPECKVEVLIPDFQGSSSALKAVVDAGPDVVNHNIETVAELYSRVRPQADYRQSLQLLERARKIGAKTKSGLMLGLGESAQQLRTAMKDLRAVDCCLLTLGQYLQPSKNHLPVDRFVHPDDFHRLKDEGMALGFEHIEAAPLVRSSYHADLQFRMKEKQ
jgi:lipoic acid synthetase